MGAHYFEEEKRFHTDNLPIQKHIEGRISSDVESSDPDSPDSSDSSDSPADFHDPENKSTPDLSVNVQKRKLDSSPSYVNHPKRVRSKRQRPSYIGE